MPHKLKNSNSAKHWSIPDKTFKLRNDARSLMTRDIYCNLGFRLGFNVGFRLGFNVGFKLGFNVGFRFVFNVGFRPILI